MAGVVLAVATLAAMATAPLLTRLYLGDGAGPANPQLATAFAWLLLPQIFFYGVGALLGALLNTRGVFAPFAWAPAADTLMRVVSPSTRSRRNTSTVALVSPATSPVALEWNTT